MAKLLGNEKDRGKKSAVEVGRGDAAVKIEIDVAVVVREVTVEAEEVTAKKEQIEVEIREVETGIDEDVPEVNLDIDPGLEIGNGDPDLLIEDLDPDPVHMKEKKEIDTTIMAEVRKEEALRWR